LDFKGLRAHLSSATVLDALTVIGWDVFAAGFKENLKDFMTF